MRPIDYVWGTHLLPEANSAIDHGRPVFDSDAIKLYDSHTHSDEYSHDIEYSRMAIAFDWVLSSCTGDVAINAARRFIK